MGIWGRVRPKLVLNEFRVRPLFQLGTKLGFENVAVAACVRFLLLRSFYLASFWFRQPKATGSPFFSSLPPDARGQRIYGTFIFLFVLVLHALISFIFFILIPSLLMVVGGFEKRKKERVTFGDGGERWGKLGGQGRDARWGAEAWCLLGRLFGNFVLVAYA